MTPMNQWSEHDSRQSSFVEMYHVRQLWEAMSSSLVRSHHAPLLVPWNHTDSHAIQ